MKSSLRYQKAYPVSTLILKIVLAVFGILVLSYGAGYVAHALMSLGTSH